MEGQMRYGEIAAKLNSITKQLSELTDTLNKIEEATPSINMPEGATLANKLALTVAETAEALSVSKATVYQLTHRDDFPCINLGKRKLIPRDMLIEWINNHCGEQL